MKDLGTADVAAVRVDPEPPFLLVHGAGWGEHDGFAFARPQAVLTERDGTFVELPSGNEVDPVRWLRQRSDRLLAGVIGYEFAWELLDIRAPRPRTSTPAIWVGEFDSPSRLEASESSGGSLGAIECTVSDEAYRGRVAACVDDIFNGELFEVNFTARFRTRWDADPQTFYDRIRRDSSGHWFGLLHAETFAVASVSPEAFIVVEDGRVVTRPIKGTRPRAEDPVRDREIAEELASSEKDRAENVMIVDLMRNDLTRVCKLGTVRASRVCELESFAGVHHLVSTVEGTLADDRTPIDVLLECFPAGSITGAPKLRAIEVAAGYEADARGPYTGTMFVSWADGLRSNVLIRTATLEPDGEQWNVAYGSGGAVVADSDPEAEWQETLTKTAPLRRMEARDDRR